MVELTALWLPILLTAVFVFIVSSILHMVLPIHKGDYKKIAGEAEFLATLRAKGLSPGHYMFPCAGSMKEMSTPEMVSKMNQGPVGLLTVLPNGQTPLGKLLFQWFLYCGLIGFVVAYVASLSLAPGAEYMKVFRLTGSVAILGFALGCISDSIWKGVSWRITAKFIFDGVIYGLVTAGTFGWLWPTT